MSFHALEAFAAATERSLSVRVEEQNSDYSSGIAILDGEIWHVRTARNTPRKPGAFVAFWRRDSEGHTAPFDHDDVESGLLVFVEHEEQRAVFAFTSAHLAQLGVTAGKHVGKRGFRVYPRWCEQLNAQATATQRAQSSAFIEY